MQYFNSNNNEKSGSGYVENKFLVDGNIWSVAQDFKLGCRCHAFRCQMPIELVTFKI